LQLTEEKLQLEQGLQSLTPPPDAASPQATDAFGASMAKSMASLPSGVSARTLAKQLTFQGRQGGRASKEQDLMRCVSLHQPLPRNSQPWKPCISTNRCRDDASHGCQNRIVFSSSATAVGFEVWATNRQIHTA
jgi:hypothetical protein